MKEKTAIWVVTDGRAGNRAQAMGLSEAIGRARPVDIRETPIALKGWAAMVPPGLSQHFPTRAHGWPFSGLAEGAEQFQWPWPGIAIGAGRRSGPVVAALGRLHQIATVQLLNPQMATGAFDAVVVPGHDDLAGANVMSTIGALNRMTPQVIRTAAEAWRDRLTTLPEPRLAVLIGGLSKSATFSEADGHNLIRALQALSRDFGLMVTTSRRTPASLVQALNHALNDKTNTMIWTGAGDNPYPALLAYAHAVLVTEDSVNMASEAASTGLPVHTFPLSRTDQKISRFHESLAARGASRRFRGQIDYWHYEPLAEADRIAADLIRRAVI
ncbi:MAG: mitochondrial fission ELM1 family protein [Pseudomonadota bacterium]